MSIRWVKHGRVTLAVHERRGGHGRPLLLLHGLGERAAEEAPAAGAWPGPVLALDFTGHGCSTVPVGGGYSAEILMADVDAVVAAIGPLSVIGHGLGAYVGLLAAGARPHEVRGVVLADGPGLAGGGPDAAAPPFPPGGGTPVGPPDPLALVELSRDPRPPAYAAGFARRALRIPAPGSPVVVTAVARPPWLAAVAAEPGVVTGSPAEGLTRLAARHADAG